MPVSHTFAIRSAAAMEALGRAVAALTSGATIVYLSGELAAGKTTFVRGYLRAHRHLGAVKSPTFTLVESYEFRGHSVHHFDLYRLADAEELEYIGLDEYFHQGADCLVEWPEQGSDRLPVADLEVTLLVDGGARLATLVGGTEKGHEIVKNLMNSPFYS